MLTLFKILRLANLLTEEEEIKKICKVDKIGAKSWLEIFGKSQTALQASKHTISHELSVCFNKKSKSDYL